MPSTTPNFGLPYPSPSDEPCDFAEQWCDFTEAIDAVFATFQEAIDRTVPTIPIAAIRKTTASSVQNLVPIPFDTVLVDTADMTELDVDSFHINVTRRGRYTVVGFLEKLSAGTPLNGQITMLISGNTVGSVALAGGIERGGAFVYRFNAFLPVISLEVGEQVSLLFNTGASGSSTVNLASLSLAWHSDTEVP